MSSNTGKLVDLLMEPVHVCMRGHPEHDALVDALVRDPAVQVVALFPADQQEGGAPNVTLDAIRAILSRAATNAVEGGGGGGTSTPPRGHESRTVRDSWEFLSDHTAGK